jgi:hypothetical protein
MDFGDQIYTLNQNTNRKMNSKLQYLQYLQFLFLIIYCSIIYKIEFDCRELQNCRIAELHFEIEKTAIIFN